MGWLSARDVLWYLTFCGFAINYMLRININIAIVGMARSRARQQTGVSAAAASCGIGGASDLDVSAANYTLSLATATSGSPDPAMFATLSDNRTELYALNNTGVSGVDIETKYTLEFNISKFTTPKMVDANSTSNTPGLTSIVEVTNSVSGINITVLSSTAVPSSSPASFKTTADHSTGASAHGASSFADSTSASFARTVTNHTSTAAAEFSDVAKGHSVSQGAAASAINTATTALSVTGRQLTSTDKTQVPQLTATGWTSTTPVVMAPVALSLTAEEDGRYDWDEYQQSQILGAFFWLHWSTQIPGGMLAQRVGPKLVFGVSNLVACLLAVLLPLAAGLDYRALIAVRVLQGFVAGVAWPSMHSMTANWIPPNDRSKFVTAYLGSSVGAALTFPLCGFLMEWFGWPTVFYTTALLGSAWFLAWWFLVFDHPHVHPRISRTELDYLNSNIGHVAKRKPPTPWKQILTSLPLWMNVVAQWGGIWGLFTMLTHAPTYFRNVHGWSIRATGLLSGFPHLCRITFAMMVSWIGDYMLKKEKISRTNLRKIATAVCTIGQGLLVLGLAYAGCSPVVAAVCLAAAVGVSGAVSTGPLASLVDIAPNYASILLGVTNMLTGTPGFIAPIVIGLLTYQNQTTDAWQVVFLITAAMLVVPGVVYILCASSELQPWNSPAAGPHEVEAAPEKTPLKADVDEDGSVPNKLYLQDDGNLLKKQRFQEDGSVLLTKQEMQEGGSNLQNKQGLQGDGSVPSELDFHDDSSILTKQDIKEDDSVQLKPRFQEDGSVFTKPDGQEDGGDPIEPDVNKVGKMATQLGDDTIASFPTEPYAATSEGVPSKPDVDKDGDVPNKSDVEGVGVPIKSDIDKDRGVPTSQELEKDGGETTKPNVMEGDSVLPTLDAQGNDSDRQRKTDVDTGHARKPDENLKTEQP